MPDWAEGVVTIQGKKENIKKFINRFLFGNDKKYKSEEEVVNEKGTRFFSRSFAFDDKKSADEMIDEISSKSSESVITAIINCDFAWSAASCLLDKPSDKPLREKYCITLPEACKEDCVSVEIETLEYGNTFEELIVCDENGNFTNSCKQMPSYKCKNCGEVWGVPSIYTVDEYECPACGGHGKDNWIINKIDENQSN